MENQKYGSEKYMPSRLEWLVVILNSLYKAGNLAANRFKLSYSSSSEQKTINVNISYYPDLDKNRLDEIRELGRDAVLITANEYGWDDWVEVNVNEELMPKKLNS